MWNALVALREEALRLCGSTTASHRPKLYELLAIAFQNSHIASWRPQYLERVVDCYREAVDTTPDDDPHKPELLLNFSKALMTLQLVANDIVPIEEALRWNRLAIRLLPNPADTSVEYHRSLADILRRRYMYEGSHKDIEEVLGFLLTAIDQAQSLKEKLVCMDSLAVAYRSRYTVNQDIKCLWKALQTHSRAAALATSEGEKDVWRDLSEGLVRDLRDLSEESSDVDAILRAISVQKDVVQ